MRNLAIDKRISLSLLLVGPLTSLAVSPSSNYDPINLIKLIFVFSVAFYVIGLMSNDLKSAFQSLPKPLLVSVIIFLMSMTFTLLFSGAPLNQQIWGSFGRNTGFLTYFSLLVILLASTLITNTDFSSKLIKSLIFTAVPMTSYCLIQIANLDPIGWSEKLPFGTLGNINFSSAFFGLSSIACLGFFLSKSNSLFSRVLCLTLIAVDLLIVYSTGSIQGILIFASGASFLVFSRIRSSTRLRNLRFLYIATLLIGVFLTLIGLMNKGPLAKLLFAPSIVFRTDYWHAGWKMTLERPFFGVGLDSYGDWYRQARGLISTTRNSPDRISNTAHNIFLDISSNGGFFLLLSYLGIVVYTLLLSIKYFKSNKTHDVIFSTMFSLWIGFMIMSLVSINQIGVGIWGWLFNGALIGYVWKSRVSSVEKETQIDNKYIKRKAKKSRKVSKSQIPAGTMMVSFLFMLVGLLLAYMPLKADAAYRSALNSNALDKIIASTRLIGSTSFHSELALDLAIKNNLTTQAYEITKYMVEKYPRDFMGWKALWLITVSTPGEKELAHKKLLEQDPFNPTVK